MKSKKYELFGSVELLAVVLFGLFFTFVIVCFTYPFVKTYKSISCVFIGDGSVSLIVGSKELSWFYKNHSVLVDGKKINFGIESEMRNVMKKDNKIYHQLVLNLKEVSKYKENDVVDLKIYQKSISFFQAFLEIWKGG